MQSFCCMFIRTLIAKKKKKDSLACTLYVNMAILCKSKESTGWALGSRTFLPPFLLWKKKFTVWLQNYTDELSKRISKDFLTKKFWGKHPAVSLASTI